MKTFDDKWIKLEYQDNVFLDLLKENQFLLVYPLRNLFCFSNVQEIQCDFFVLFFFV